MEPLASRPLPPLPGSAQPARTSGQLDEAAVSADSPSSAGTAPDSSYLLAPTLRDRLAATTARQTALDGSLLLRTASAGASTLVVLLEDLLDAVQALAGGQLPAEAQSQLRATVETLLANMEAVAGAAEAGGQPLLGGCWSASGLATLVEGLGLPPSAIRILSGGTLPDGLYSVVLPLIPDSASGAVSPESDAALPQQFVPPSATPLALESTAPAVVAPGATTVPASSMSAGSARSLPPALQPHSAAPAGTQPGPSTAPAQLPGSLALYQDQREKSPSGPRAAPLQQAGSGELATGGRTGSGWATARTGANPLPALLPEVVAGETAPQLPTVAAPAGSLPLPALLQLRPPVAAQAQSPAASGAVSGAVANLRFPSGAEALLAVQDNLLVHPQSGFTMTVPIAMGQGGLVQVLIRENPLVLADAHGAAAGLALRLPDLRPATLGLLPLALGTPQEARTALGRVQRALERVLHQVAQLGEGLQNLGQETAELPAGASEPGARQVLPSGAAALLTTALATSIAQQGAAALSVQGLPDRARIAMLLAWLPWLAPITRRQDERQEGRELGRRPNRQARKDRPAPGSQAGGSEAGNDGEVSPDPPAGR